MDAEITSRCLGQCSIGKLDFMVFSTRLLCVWCYLALEWLCSVVLPTTVDRCVSPHPPLLSSPGHVCVGLFTQYFLLWGGDGRRSGRQAAQHALRSTCCVFSHLAEQICLALLWWAPKALLLTLLWYWLLHHCGIHLLVKVLSASNVIKSARFLFLCFHFFVLRLTDAESLPY